VSPKQLLVGTELQHHKCDPVEDSRQYIGHREPTENAGLPHLDSKPTGGITDSHGYSSKPSAGDLSHHKNVGKSLKTGVHYSHSVSHHAHSEQRNQGGVVKYPQSKYRPSGFRQQKHDSRSAQVYDLVTTQGSIHQQKFGDMVSQSVNQSINQCQFFNLFLACLLFILSCSSVC